jgi:hypothetical protein
MSFMRHEHEVSGAPVEEQLRLAMVSQFGQRVVAVVNDPLVDLPWMAADIKASPNTTRQLIKRGNLVPVMVSPRCPRYRLSAWEVLKASLPRGENRNEPRSLSVARAKLTVPGGARAPESPASQRLR